MQELNVLPTPGARPVLPWMRVPNVCETHDGGHEEKESELVVFAPQVAHFRITTREKISKLPLQPMLLFKKVSASWKQSKRIFGQLISLGFTSCLMDTTEYTSRSRSRSSISFQILAVQPLGFYLIPQKKTWKIRGLFLKPTAAVFKKETN